MNADVNLDACNGNTYVLDKAIWSKYDMVATKRKVINYLEELKENRAKNLATICNYGLTSSITNVISKATNRINSFSNKVDELVDEEVDIRKLERVKESFPELELKYYIYCLENNHSENEFAENIGKRSRYGLSSIKNSCILKIALAFNIAVLKDE